MKGLKEYAMMHYYSLAEMIQKEINNCEILKDLKKDRDQISKQINHFEDVITTKMFFNYYNEDNELKVEAENGTTASVFGNTFEIYQMNFSDKEEDRRFIIRTDKFVTSICTNNLIIMKNGCIKFQHLGITHYANIVEWDKLMKQLYF